MTRTTNKITRSMAPALVMAALIAPTAGAYQDISSQDMRDVAEPSAPASGRHDLRSRDALDAARSLPPDQLAAVAEGLRPAHHDLRSQDALDAARSLPPDQLAAVAEGLRSGADGSDVGLMSGRVLDLVRIGLARIAPFTPRGTKLEAVPHPRRHQMRGRADRLGAQHGAATRAAPSCWHAPESSGPAAITRRLTPRYSTRSSLLPCAATELSPGSQQGTCSGRPRASRAGPASPDDCSTSAKQKCSGGRSARSPVVRSGRLALGHGDARFRSESGSAVA